MDTVRRQAEIASHRPPWQEDCQGGVPALDDPQLPDRDQNRVDVGSQSEAHHRHTNLSRGESAQAEAEYVEIGFEMGEPVSIDGENLGPVALLSKLNDLGGAHGIGRVDLVENRFVGMKSRGVYETPGVTILHAAHRALESITMDREVMHLRDTLEVKFAENVYYGFWFAPEFDLMRKMIDETQKNVSGEVRLKLYRGNVIVVGRRSPYSLYDERVATFEADTVYNQRDAEGFIKLNALRLRLRGGDRN